MWAVEVVVMQPGVELKFSLGRVVVGAGVSPFSESGLDEAFGLAVGAWSVGLGETVFEVLPAESLAEEPVPVAGAIVGEHAADGEAEACVVGASQEEEEDRRAVGLVGQDGGEGEAAVVPSASLRAG